MKNSSWGEKNIFELAKEHKILYSAQIELTSKCNWKCINCYIPNHSERGIEKRKVFDTLKQLRDIGTFEINFTGGEVFCRDDAMEIIEMARSMHFNVTILSNISLLDEGKIKELASLTIGEIACTIFSVEDRIHDSISGVVWSLKTTMVNGLLLKDYGI